MISLGNHRGKNESTHPPRRQVLTVGDLSLVLHYTRLLCIHLLFHQFNQIFEIPCFRSKTAPPPIDQRCTLGRVLNKNVVNPSTPGVRQGNGDFKFKAMCGGCHPHLPRGFAGRTQGHLPRPPKRSIFIFQCLGHFF